MNDMELEDREFEKQLAEAFATPAAEALERDFAGLMLEALARRDRRRRWVMAVAAIPGAALAAAGVAALWPMGPVDLGLTVQSLLDGELYWLMHSKMAVWTAVAAALAVIAAAGIGEALREE